jgi:hypothetical protein
MLLYMMPEKLLKLREMGTQKMKEVLPWLVHGALHASIRNFCPACHGCSSRPSTK